MSDAHLDEELSALIDGELDAEQERRLRTRIDAEPQLAERLARLRGVDAALRALPETPLPAGLQASLRERIAREAVAEGQAEQAGNGEVRALPPRRRLPRWAGAAVAAAAALVVWVLMPDVDPAPDEGWVPELAGTVSSDDGSLASATDEEIGIVLDYEMLADLEVIEDLELLEWMAEQDEQTSGSDGTERG
jgi:anti-sigma factor RsiW